MDMPLVWTGCHGPGTGSDPRSAKHLRLLATAGLVESRREGYYVLYSLVPERIDALSEGVRRFMDS